MIDNFFSLVRYGRYVCLFALVACGGSGGGGLGGASTAGNDAWQQGVFPDQSLLADRCETPRQNSDDRAGSEQFEKMWLRSWSDDFYLWYDEIPDQNPASFSVLDYFDELVTPATTPSGQPRDKFHFYWDTEEYQQFTQSGVRSGYGLQLAIDQSAGAPRRIFVVYVEPNSPASDAGVLRGDEFLSIDGTAVSSNTPAGVNVLNAGLFPNDDGEMHSFVVRNLSSTDQRAISMISDSVVTTPVVNVQSYDTSAGRVGYFLFNDHIATAERGLVQAVESLAGANIDELVIDLRYNGGGRLVIASQLAYMVAGAARTAGRTFERLQFNDKYSADLDPVTGARNDPIPFYSTTLGLSLASGQPLPSLNLDRVFVLATEDTCSASESIINALRGVGVEVILIGDTTCGKPYGFYPRDNCGTTYFTIQFRGVNDQNFGDFSDGFSPANESGITGVTIPGCEVADNITQDLGDTNEDMLATAINYVETGSCSTVSPKPNASLKPSPFAESGLRLYGVPEWKKSRILEVDVK